MFRDKEEELKRLESALLEQEEPAPAEVILRQDYGEEAFDEEEFYDEPQAEEDFSAYNNVLSDVDLGEYSRQVYEGTKKGSNGLWVVFLVVLTVLFCVLGYFVLKQGGYLG